MNNEKYTKNMRLTEYRSESITRATQNPEHCQRMRAFNSELWKPHIHYRLSRLCAWNLTLLDPCKITDVTSHSNITNRRATEGFSFPSLLPQSLNER
jgi:hypothetical protein